MEFGIITGIVVAMALVGLCFIARELCERMRWATDTPVWERTPKWETGVWNKDPRGHHYIRDDGISVLRHADEQGSYWIIKVPASIGETDPESFAILNEKYENLADAVNTVDRHWPLSDGE